MIERRRHHHRHAARRRPRAQAAGLSRPRRRRHPIRGRPRHPAPGGGRGLLSPAPPHIPAACHLTGGAATVRPGPTPPDLRRANLSLLITQSTAGSLGFAPDGRNRDVPIRVPLPATACDLELRRMELLADTGQIQGRRKANRTRRLTTPSPTFDNSSCPTCYHECGAT